MSRPITYWDEIREVNKLIIQVNPEVIGRHNNGFIINDPASYVFQFI